MRTVRAFLTRAKSTTIAVMVSLASIASFPGYSFASPLELLQPHFQSWPACEDRKVLDEIVERFNEAEEDFYHRNIYLSGISRIRHGEVVPKTESRLIARRYCRADAQMSTGGTLTLFYLIEGGQGFAGTGYHVAFCINGLDSQRFFDGSCRALNH